MREKIKTFKCGPHNIYVVDMSQINIDDKRKKELFCAQFLYNHIFKTTTEIRRSTSGYIIWPDNFVGSLSHKKNLLILCVEEKNKFNSIGIDIENFVCFNEKVKNKICSSEELSLLAKLNLIELQRKKFLSVIFSVKEAVFKAYFPIYEQKIYFKDFEITNIDFKHGIANGKFTNKFEDTKSNTQNLQAFFCELDENIVSVISTGSSC
jgi:phosphopantetheine--protein transferase-like protein